MHVLEEAFVRAMPWVLRRRWLSSALGIPQTVALMARLPAQCTAKQMLESLRRNTSVRVHAIGGERVPATGPLLVAANHPFPVIDTYCVSAALERYRAGGEIRVIVDAASALLPELQHRAIYTGATQADMRRLVRDTDATLSAGGVVCVFPAGEAAFRSVLGKYVEAPWKAGVCKMARRHKAPILPVFLAGRESWRYRLARSILPRSAVRIFNLRRAHTRPVDHRIIFGEILNGDNIDIEDVKRAVYALASGQQCYLSGQDRRLAEAL